MCRYIAYTESRDDFFVSEEHSIYGSSRLGLQTRRDTLYQNATITPDFEYVYRDLGTKQYELSIPIAIGVGNVLATVTDQHKPIATLSTIDSYEPVIVSISDYYPFGSAIADRSWSDASRAYRYACPTDQLWRACPTGSFRRGFNGKEKDKEGMGGGGATYDYGFRIYNPNLGRFLSVDPLFHSYPWYTPYQFAGNKPIWCIDIDGLEELSTNDGTGTTIGPSTDPNSIVGPPQDFPPATCRVKSPKLSNADKATIFGVNFGISAIVTGLVATIVTAIASPIITSVAIVVGVYCITKSVVELCTGRNDWGTGDKMTEAEKWSEAGSLAGGVVGGAVGAKLGVKVRTKIKAHSKKYDVSKSSNLTRIEDVGVGIKVRGGGVRESSGYNKSGGSLEKKLGKRQEQGYDFKTTEDMVNYGQEFFKRTGDNILEFKDRFGNIHRLDINTQEYGIIMPDGTIQSVFKVEPKAGSNFTDGESYMQNQINEWGTSQDNGGTGGDSQPSESSSETESE